jgi:chaperonin GroES
MDLNVQLEAEDAIRADIQEKADMQSIDLLMQIAAAEGDVSEYLKPEQIADVIDQVCTTYELDKESRSDWAKVAEEALKEIGNTKSEAKNSPWPNASNVKYPLLATAVMQFNARAYPAVVKGDEAVSCKVVGNDTGMPRLGPDGQPLFQFQGMPVIFAEQGPSVATPQGPVPLPEGGDPTPVWKREPGDKTKRAQRVRQYMNYMLFYQMDAWESETDTLLFQMPAIGCGFRKTWFDGRKHQSKFVPALNLVVNNAAKSLDDAPQITEEIDGIYPHQIKRDIRTGKYRQDVTFDPDEKEPRLLIETQAYFDLDDDGVDEPYIVTIDHKSKQLLRIVPDFGPDQVQMAETDVAYIERRKYYTKYGFMPNPEGTFYNIGLAHLLHQYGNVINTLVNQMIDANTAAVSGGGFVASGLKLQGRGQSSSLRWRPGEYKTVPVSGDALRNGIVERTFPQVSQVMFNLLDLILGAARDIASIKDILTGEGSNNGQVGTTLALIEQGLQVFTAIYKRVYLGLKGEFKILYYNIGAYANERAQKEYIELLDDPAANVLTDFDGRDMDVCPVSDPSSVTKMQRMGKAQFLFSTIETVMSLGGDGREILRRVYEAADVEDIEKILPPPPPPGPEQAMAMADMEATVRGKVAKAVKDETDAAAKAATVELGAGTLQLNRDKAELEALKAGMGMVDAA